MKRWLFVGLLGASACKTATAPASEPAAPTEAAEASPSPEPSPTPEPVVAEPAVADPQPAPPAERLPPRPGVERLEAWLDTKAVRRSPYAANTLAILDDFPFFVFQDGGLDPLRDIDYIHVSGPPYGVHGLEAVARHGLNRASMQSACERAVGPEGFTVSWSGDVGTVKQGGPNHAGLYDGFAFALADKKHVVLTETPGMAKAAVDRLEKFRGKNAGVALAIDYFGVTGWLPDDDGTEVMLPHEVSLRVDASKSPTPKVTLRFVDEAQSTRAVAYLKEDVKRLIDSRAEFRITIGALFDSAKIDRKGNTVAIEVELTAEQANLLLTVAEGLVARATPHDPDRDARREALRKSTPPR